MGLRQSYLGIGLPLCKMTVSFYFPLVSNTQLNLLYTKIMLLIAIELALAFGSWQERRSASVTPNVAHRVRLQRS